MKNRASEYAAAKAVEQHPNFAAEHPAVSEFAKRRSNNTYATYNAPNEHMNYFDIHLKRLILYDR